MTRRAAIYARLSRASDESVSIARQIQSAEHYAKAYGWQVVATFTDDGVSATANQPDARPGWRALLDSKTPFDTILVWKVDRLSRRLTDFWDTYRSLEATGRTLVSVEERLDMTTAIGRTFAGIIAGFAEVEAEAISTRVRDARRYLLSVGRAPGGTVPYGWQTAPNLDGAGYVLAHDPERIEYVRGVVERLQRGHTLYSCVQWLDEVGAPLPTGSQGSRKRGGWSYTTLDRLIRNPILAGLRPNNPGNDSKQRGPRVLRKDGEKVVDPSIAVMSVPAWEALVRSLEDRDSPQSRPRALKGKTSALLSGLVRCGNCDGRRMHRGTTQGRESFKCPDCYQTISRIEPYVIERFLAAKGEHVRWTAVEEVYEASDVQVTKAQIANRLAEVGVLLSTATDPAEIQALAEELAELHQQRAALGDRDPETTVAYAPGALFAEAWAAATTLEDRRAVLDDALDHVTVNRGKVGRGLDTGRLAFTWKDPEHVGPVTAPDQATLAAWAEDSPGSRR